MSVDDAATLLRTTWDTDSTTVGGMVTAALGHLPLALEKVGIGEYEFEVERVAERAVESVLARRTAPRREDEE
jgi:Mg2+/Co2+ transporter CorC